MLVRFRIKILERRFFDDEDRVIFRGEEGRLGCPEVFNVPIREIDLDALSHLYALLRPDWSGSIELNPPVDINRDSLEVLDCNGKLSGVKLRLSNKAEKV
jgi:hypothetical protein